MQLAKELQPSTTGRVLTCSNVSRSAFLDAVTLPQPSGYPGDASAVPTLVTEPAGAADVKGAVQFAAAHNLEIAVKGGGWSFRNTWRADGGLTVDLSAMKAVHIDAAHQEIVAQGGAVYGDILAATEPYDLALPWGVAVQTGNGGMVEHCMGLALGGGIGYLMRPHGLTSDNIINASIVLANGSEVTASSSKNADVLAAMRGGGTAFGVVTEVAFKVHDVFNYHGGAITYRDDTTCMMLRAAHQWAAKAMAEELSLGVEVIAKAAASGESLVRVQVGMPGSVPEEVRQNIIAPLQDLPDILENSLDSLNYTAFERSVTPLVEAAKYKSQYFISAVLTFQQAEDGLLDLLPFLLHDVPADFTCTFLADYLGSTNSNNAVKNTALFTGFGGEIDFHFFIKYEWPAGVNDAANSAFAQQRIEEIAPYVTSTQPYHNLATVVSNATLEYQVGGASNLAELRRLKQELDPNNLFKRHGLVGLYHSDDRFGVDVIDDINDIHGRDVAEL